MEKPALTLVFPNVLNGRLFAGCDYHLGAGYIRAFLSKHGVGTVQYLDDGRYSASETARRIVACDGDLIGFSVYDANYHMVRVLAAKIRRLQPDIPIIFGGPSATFSDRLIMWDCPAVDICTRSYAEETALDLIEWSRKQKAIEGIDGITYRSGDEIVRNPDRKQAMRHKIPADSPPAGTGYQDTGGTLDDYPDPYLSGFLPPKRVSDIGLVTSRGCTYSCTFCNFSAMSGWSIASHSIAHQLRVFRHLEDALAGTPTLVTINDDNFSLQGKRFHELLRRMSEEDYRTLSFWAEMRTETLSEETFKLLKSARFGEVNFGLESAEPRVLAAMKKVRASGWDRDDYAKERRFLNRVKWAVAQARMSGIRTTVSVIFGAPTETYDDGLRTLDFIKEVEADGYSHNFMVVGDGTELAQNYKSYGLKSEYPRDRILPPRTTVPYDVYQLPILPNDQSWLPMTSFEMRQVSFLHSGVAQFQRHEVLPMGNGRGGGGRERDCLTSTDAAPYQPVVMFAEGAVDEALCGWLKQEFPLNTSLWLEQQSLDARESAQRLLNISGVPVPELNAIRFDRIDHGKATYRINEFSNGAPDFNTRILHLQRASTAALEVLQAEVKGALKRQANVLRIELADDLDVFGAWKDADDRWSVPTAIAAARVDVEDSCRWCSGKCPAQSLNRVFVHEDRSVVTCRSGGAIGRVGDPVEQLEERLAELRLETEQARGCATCAVRSSCAKCLYTAPLTATEYCARKRNREEESTLMDSLVALRGMLDNGALSFASPNITIRPMRALSGSTIENQGAVYPVDDFIFIDQGAGEQSILFSQKANLSLSLGSEDAAVLRALT